MENINLEQLQENKDKKVKELIEFISNSEDIVLITKIMFFLVKNYRHKDIFGLLVQLIADERYKNNNGSLVYLCGEYSLYECSKNVDFFIKLICNYDGEVGMTSFNILLDSVGLIDFKEEKVKEWLYQLNLSAKEKPNRYIISAIQWLEE